MHVSSNSDNSLICHLTHESDAISLMVLSEYFQDQCLDYTPSKASNISPLFSPKVPVSYSRTWRDEPDKENKRVRNQACV